jgi:hypothetical protein
MRFVECSMETAHTTSIDNKRAVNPLGERDAWTRQEGT